MRLPLPAIAPPTIVVDTREQTPWVPSIHRDGRRILLPVVRRALVAGDYTIDPHEHEIAIERKSLADWIGTLFGATDRADGSREDSFERFRREIARATEGVTPADGSAPTPPLIRFMVIVEASRGDVRAHRYRSQVLPQSVLGRSDSIFTDYGVPVQFAGDREEAERLAMWTLVRWWEAKQRAKGATAAQIAAAFKLGERGAGTAEPAAEATKSAARMRPIGEQLGGDPRARKAAAKRLHERSGAR